MPATSSADRCGRRPVGAQLFSAALFVAALTNATAQDAYIGPAPGTATAPETGVWSVSESWLDGAVPLSSSTTHLSFGGSGSGSYTATNDLPAGFILNQLTLDSSSSGLVTLAGNTLALDNGEFSPLIEQLGPGAVTISNNLDLRADTLVDVAGTAGTLTLSGAISGGELDSNWLEKEGGGTLILAGSTVNTLATLDVYEGTVEFAKSSGVALTEALYVADGATVRLTAGGQFSSETEVAIDGTLELSGHDTTIAALTFGSPILEGEVKLGGATLTITGAPGDEDISFFNGLVSGEGAVVIGPEASFTGSATFALENGSVTVVGDLLPGGYFSDVLTIGSDLVATDLILAGSSLLLLDICGCNENNSLEIFGDLQMEAGATLDLFAEDVLSGSYTFATFSGDLVGAFDNILYNGDSILDPTAIGAFGGTHHLIYGEHSISLVPSAIPEPSTYAALFGASALACAAWRRRRRDD
jgi:hypothetical protein